MTRPLTASALIFVAGIPLFVALSLLLATSLGYLPLSEQYSLIAGGALILIGSSSALLISTRVRRRREGLADRKPVAAALHREKEHAHVTLRAIADGVITTDAQELVQYLNPAAETLLCSTHAIATGQPLSKVLPLTNDIGMKSPVETLLSAPGTFVGGTGEAPLLLTRKDGERIYIEKSAAKIRDLDGTSIGYIIVFRDVTDSLRMTQQLAHQATHDALTGAINRREFESRVRRVLADNSNGAAICYLDLDQFKVVNDTCGHSAGDELLCQITQVLRSHLRQRDTLARLGGDEFGVLLEHCTLGDAFRLADGIREAVHGFRFEWDAKTFSLGVSIGLVEIAGHGVTFAEVLSAADTACYMAKEKGRNRVQIHHHQDRQIKPIRGEVCWLSLINAALEDDRFRLFYQDIVSTQDTTRSGLGKHVEILVRMLDSEGKLAMPGAFLPVAERYNVIQATDRWVVRRVFEWMVMPERGHQPQIASINLSGPTVSDGSFLDFILDAVTETGVPTQRICFEITETSAMTKHSTARALIQALKKRGFLLAVDDFGNGLASFEYLQTLPVDYIKIDGSFVRDMVRNPINRAIVRSINDIGHMMGKKTIAEFAEDIETLNVLREIGVDLAQGYGISYPKPLEQLDRNLRLVATST